MVEDEEISYWQMVSCVCLGLVSRGEVEEVTALLELLYVYSLQEVVFGCKNYKLIAFSPENFGWAG